MAVPLAAVIGRLGPMLGRSLRFMGGGSKGGGFGGGGFMDSFIHLLKDPKTAKNIENHEKIIKSLRNEYKNLAKQGKDTKAVEMELTEAQEALGESQAASREETQALTKGLGSLRTIAQGVLFKVGALKVAILGMAYAGGQGTVEMYRLNRQFHLINRNVFASLMPMFELLTKVITKIRTFMQNMSGFQQDVLLAFTAGLIGITVAIGGAIAGVGALVSAVALLSNPIGWLVMALSAVAAAIAAAFVFSPGLRQEMIVLWEQLKRLFQQLKPLIDATLAIMIGGLEIFGTYLRGVVFLLNITLEILNRMVEKIKEYINYMRLIPGMNTLINSFDALAAAGSSGFGFESGLGGGKEGRYPRLMQTGTESLQGTFQRFQQEIFKVSADKDKPKDAAESILDILLNWDKSIGAGAAGSMKRGSPEQSTGSWLSSMWGGK